MEALLGMQSPDFKERDRRKKWVEKRRGKESRGEEGRSVILKVEGIVGATGPGFPANGCAERG